MFLSIFKDLSLVINSLAFCLIFKPRVLRIKFIMLVITCLLILKRCLHVLLPNKYLSIILTHDRAPPLVLLFNKFDTESLDFDFLNKTVAFQLLP